MLLKDILKLIYERQITIYEENGDDYKNLFSGELDDIPSSLMNRKVRLIGASGAQHLDIQLFVK